MGKYDYVYELNLRNYKKDMEIQVGRGNNDKKCDVDIRGEVRLLCMHSWSSKISWSFSC